MTVRRINHTGRIRLHKKDVHLVVHAGDDPAFVAELDLGEYGLPADALVFLEVYRQTSWQRFSMGTVGAPVQPLSASLSSFGTAVGVRFSVRVVARQPDTGRPAMVLASCDGMRPKTEHGEAESESILPVEFGSFSDRVWKLEIEDDQAILRVSRALVADSSALVQSKAFRSLVLPEVLRAILDRFVVQDRCIEIDEDDPSRSEWLRFATEYLGVPLPAAEDDLVEWVDEAVRVWCQRTAVPEEFSGWWEGASG